MLQVGIVGLPNVGKSTLFNAVTKTRNAQAANYPFCTIDPNTGIVTVPDARLERLSQLSHSQKVIPAAIEFIDIAGLVKGASQGEGLGNQFLAHIRQADAIVQVVRCFEDENIHHVSGRIDPLTDIEVINTELILADLATLQKRSERLQKQVRAADREAKKELDLLQKLEPHLNQNFPARTFSFTDDEKKIVASLHLLSMKPTLFACNVAEKDLANASQNIFVKQVKDYVVQHLDAEVVVISAQIEADLVDLSTEDAVAYLKELGVEESGVGALIRAAYHLLGLQTYFTTGEKETRAWTIHKGDTAPRAAGVIHTDFERGFIAAETVAYDDLITLGSFAKAREMGKLRLEGKEYIVKDGDVMEFRFNV
ncbi:MAG: redox-regulated ATPase YchF [Verrucomicrobiae bacterium]|nr:redox-regulated ATPase YchF [Verrucomicrobiae bacterium]